jgi:hypothetical protein
MSVNRSWRSPVMVVAAAAAVLAQSPKAPSFSRVAEGFTSRDKTSGVEVAYRMFTAPTIRNTCAESGRPFRLLSPHGQVVLRVGEWFDLRRLVFVGLDRGGNVVRPAPISVEVEDKEPPLLNLRSDMISDGRLLGIRPGHFRFRARTICDESPVEVIVEAVVRERGGNQ